MRIGPYEVNDGAVYLAIFVVVFLIALLIIWRQNAQVGDDLKSFAQIKGWTWHGAATPELKGALGKLHDEYGWSASKVMAASTTIGTAYLFQYQRKRVSGTNKHSDQGIACLIPGRTDDHAPQFSVQRKPPGNLGKLVSERDDVVEGVGSQNFQNEYIVRSAVMISGKTKDGKLIDNIEITLALESAIDRWRETLGAGAGISTIYIRDQLVLAAKHGGQKALLKELQGLLDMCSDISQARRGQG